MEVLAKYISGDWPCIYYDEKNNTFWKNSQKRYYGIVEYSDADCTIETG